MDRLHKKNRSAQVYVIHRRGIAHCLLRYPASFRLRQAASESHEWQGQEAKKRGLEMGQLNKIQKNTFPKSLTATDFALLRPRLECASPRT